MNQTLRYTIGDQVQTEDGQVGVVIDVDRDPTAQDSTHAQTIVVQFPDLSTVEGLATRFSFVPKHPVKMSS